MWFGEEKGSVRSGEERERSTGGACVGEECGVVKGWRDIRRTASIMVGWKRPPRGECPRRWVGRVWPKVKNMEVNLLSF